MITPSFLSVVLLVASAGGCCAHGAPATTLTTEIGPTSQAGRPGQCPPLTYPSSVASSRGRFKALVVADSQVQKEVRIVRQSDGKRLAAFRVDLTNLFWLPDNSGVVFAVSPIYDRPGIFLYDLAEGKTTRLVAPRNLSGNPGYKDGADWFMLCSVEMSPGGAKLFFLRFDDVDALDFRKLDLGAPQDSIVVPRR